MEVYYRINGDETLGILPKKPKRYNSSGAALSELKRVLESKGIDESIITHGLTHDALPVMFIPSYDSEYWISKETIQPVYVVMEEDESSLGGRNIHAIFDSEVHAQQYLSELAYNSGVTFDRSDSALTIVDDNVLSYWIERHEVEIYD